VNNSVKSLSTQNINSMKDTVVLLTFEDSSGLTLGGLTITDSQLSLPSTNSQGTATTNETTILGYNATYFEARGQPNDFCNISYYRISSDGGQTWNNSGEQYSLVGKLNQQIAFTTSGNNIVVELTLKSDTTNTSPKLSNFTLLVK